MNITFCILLSAGISPILKIKIILHRTELAYVHINYLDGELPYVHVIKRKSLKIYLYIIIITKEV